MSEPGDSATPDVRVGESDARLPVATAETPTKEDSSQPAKIRTPPSPGESTDAKNVKDQDETAGGAKQESDVRAPAPVDTRAPEAPAPDPRTTQRVPTANPAVGAVQAQGRPVSTPDSTSTSHSTNSAQSHNAPRAPPPESAYREDPRGYHPHYGVHPYAHEGMHRSFGAVMGGMSPMVGVPFRQYAPPMQPVPVPVAYGHMPPHAHTHGPQVASAAGDPGSPYGGSSMEPKPSAPACINCQKSHLACDRKIPCGRCVSKNKEATCTPAVYKKRGWQLGRRRTSLVRDRMMPFGMYYGGMPFMDPAMAMHPMHYGAPVAPFVEPMPMMLPPPPAEMAYATPYDPSAATCTLAVDGHVLNVSPMFCMALGYQDNDIVGTNIADHLHPVDVNAVLSELQGAAHDDGVRRFRCRMRPNHLDGYVVVEIVGRTYAQDPMGESSVCFFGTMRVLEQYAGPAPPGDVAGGFRQGSARQGATGGAAAAGGGGGRFTARCAPDGTCVDVSAGVRYVLGFGQLETTSMWGCHLVHPEDLWRVASFHDSMVAGGPNTTGAGACRVRTKAGDYLDVDFQANTYLEGATVYVQYDIGPRDLSRPPVYLAPTTTRGSAAPDAQGPAQETGLAVRRTMRARGDGPYLAGPGARSSPAFAMPQHADAGRPPYSQHQR